MVFSSLLFLFWFLPIFFGIYYLCPSRFRNGVLFLGSILFYAWGEPKYLILIVISIAANYLSGLLIHFFDNRAGIRKACLISILLFDIGLLVVFKYTDFVLENCNRILKTDFNATNIVLPLGISFYTFQIMSYVIDLYRRKIQVEKSILRLGVYLVMFPQLIAGPIVVYSKVAQQLEGRKCSLKDFEDGLKIFILGLGSKVLIANNIGVLWDDFAVIGYENLSMPLAWLGILAFSLQIYFDFNGYSLMAIGLGKMLGFSIPQNFDFPYIAKSVTEFWRRWHMTLSSWFKEYLYIPLGGNQNGKLKTYVNLFIVWSITGLWHGASWNFILWGIFFFVLLAIERAGFGTWLESHTIFARAYTLLSIGCSWMIFALTDFAELRTYASKLFSFQVRMEGINGNVIYYYLGNYGFVLVLGIILSTPILKNWYDKNKSKVAGICLLTFIMLASIAYLVDASYNPFLYFRF